MGPPPLPTAIAAVDDGDDIGVGGDLQDVVLVGGPRRDADPAERRVLGAPVDDRALVAHSARTRGL